MPTPYRRALRFVLKREGGYVNHPSDPGGHTNMGVTLATFTQWRRSLGEPDPTVDDLKALTHDEAFDLYRAMYWDAVKGDSLPEPVAHLLFDMAVNAGPSRAIKLLQEALGVTADGIIGPQTIAAANRADPRQAVIRFTVERLFHYIGLGTFSTFGRGWLTRSVDAAITAATLAQSAPSLSPSLAAPTPAEIEGELAGEGEKEAPPAVPIAIAVVAAAILGALVLVLR